MNGFEETLRIQVCPKKGINPTILLWGWDWDHQTYPREGYGSVGKNIDRNLREKTPKKPSEQTQWVVGVSVGMRVGPSWPSTLIAGSKDGPCTTWDVQKPCKA